MPLLWLWAFLNVISQMTDMLTVGFHWIRINVMRIKCDCPQYFLVFFTKKKTKKTLQSQTCKPKSIMQVAPFSVRSWSNLSHQSGFGKLIWIWLCHFGLTLTFCIFLFRGWILYWNLSHSLTVSLLPFKKVLSYPK